MNPELEKYGGSEEVMAIVDCFESMLHTWDDLVDKDKEVPQSDINKAFLTALSTLPSIQLYRFIQPSIIPMWESIVMAFEASNKFEKDKDPHGIEIGHNLRYAAGHIISYAMIVALGRDRTSDLMPVIWKEIVAERFEDYRKEHLEA